MEGCDERWALVDAQVEEAPRQPLLQIGRLRVAGEAPVEVQSARGGPLTRPIRARIHDGDEDQSSARGSQVRFEEFLYGVDPRHLISMDAGLDDGRRSRNVRLMHMDGNGGLDEMNAGRQGHGTSGWPAYPGPMTEPASTVSCSVAILGAAYSTRSARIGPTLVRTTMRTGT